MKTLIGIGVALIGMTPAVLGQSAREPSPEPVQMTLTGCLYEVSGPATPPGAPNVSLAQTTRYVLRDVARVPNDGKEADTPVATSGERAGRGTAAARGGRPGDAADAGDAGQRRILFANDTQARMLVGRRVQLRGRLSPETFEEQQDAREVIESGRAPSPQKPRERGEVPERPIPQFHAEAIAPLAGRCPGADR